MPVAGPMLEGLAGTSAASNAASNTGTSATSAVASAVSSLGQTLGKRVTTVSDVSASSALGPRRLSSSSVEHLGVSLHCLVRYYPSCSCPGLEKESSIAPDVTKIPYANVCCFPAADPGAAAESAAAVLLCGGVHAT